MCARELCEMLVHKYSEPIEYVKNWSIFLRILQVSRVENLRIRRIKNVKFLGYCFYMNTNILRDFQICISVPLISNYFACFDLIIIIISDVESITNFLNSQ